MRPFSNPGSTGQIAPNSQARPSTAGYQSSKAYLQPPKVSPLSRPQEYIQEKITGPDGETSYRKYKMGKFLGKVSLALTPGRIRQVL